MVRRTPPARGSAKRSADPPALRLTSDQVLASRLRRQHLLTRAKPAAMLEVIGDLCGLHAQLMTSAELTLHARVEGLSREAVQHALWKQRSLFKTWAMRGTLHLLPTSEYGLWQAGLGTYRHYRKASWSKYFGVSPAQLDRILDAVARALDGRQLTRDELADQVAQLTRSRELGDKLRESWGALLKPASFQGKLCFAPNRGQNVRFTRPDTWLDVPAAMESGEAMREITRRYLAAHGPATREDFGRWWGGLTPAQSQKHLLSLGADAVQVDVEGSRAWMLASDATEARELSAGRVVRLLPAFDQYVVGASRSVPEYVRAKLRDRVYRAQGWLSAVVLIGGRMEGAWEYERKGRKVAITVSAFAALPAWARREVEGEAERIASFLGGAPELAWSRE